MRGADISQGYITGILSKNDNYYAQVLGKMRMGIEVEFTGVNRRDLAETMVKEGYFKDCVEEIHTVSGCKRIRLRLVDSADNYWYLVVDRSISPVIRQRIAKDEDIDFMCELVSPVLEDGQDILFFMLVIMKIRDLGGVVNDTCGIHVHLDAPQDIDTLKDIFYRFLMTQDDVSMDLCIPECRLNKYVKKYPKEFVKDYISCKDSIGSIGELQDFLYDRLEDGVSRDDEKNPARYYMLNLDSLHKRGTIEFRMFNSSLDNAIINKYLCWLYLFVG